MGEISDRINEWWLTQNDERDFKLSPSVLGHVCDRNLWYRLHKYPEPPLTGQQLRLFNRGHREEDVFIKGLNGIGMYVYERQKHVHPMGQIDGMVYVDGVPHLVEFKTFNNRRFCKLLKDGIPHSHKVQMQFYMGGLNLKRALYLAVNKDTDELFDDFYDFDEKMYLAQMRRKERIQGSLDPPVRIDNRPEYFVCKMCCFNKECHNV